MRRVVHVSDLHFGTVRKGIVESLVSDVRDFEPDLVVVTGDLTQRATDQQFEDARKFLQALKVPQLVIPGNHDIAPLYHPLRRLFRPFAGFRRHLSIELDTVFADDQLLVIGLNTVQPLRWKEGAISRRQLSLIAEQADRHPHHFRVVAAHHPLASLLVGSSISKVRRHAELLETLESADIALCMTGHLHESARGPFASALGQAHRTLVVRASTATSARVRSHRNAYNRLLIRPSRLEICVRAWTGQAFETDHVEHFQREQGHWQNRHISEPVSGLDASDRPI